MKDRLARAGLSAAILFGGGAVAGTAVAQTQDRGVYFVEPGFCRQQFYIVPEGSQIAEEGLIALEEIVRQGQFAYVESTPEGQQPVYTISTWGDPSVSLAESMGKGGEFFIYPFPVNELNIDAGRAEESGNQTLELGYNRIKITNAMLGRPAIDDFTIPCPDADVYIRSLSNDLVMASLTENIDENGYPGHNLRIIPSESSEEVDLQAVILPRNC